MPFMSADITDTCRFNMILRVITFSTGYYGSVHNLVDVSCSVLFFYSIVLASAFWTLFCSHILEFLEITELPHY